MERGGFAEINKVLRITMAAGTGQFGQCLMEILANRAISDMPNLVMDDMRRPINSNFFGDPG